MLTQEAKDMAKTGFDNAVNCSDVRVVFPFPAHGSPFDLGQRWRNGSIDWEIVSHGLRATVDTIETHVWFRACTPGPWEPDVNLNDVFTVPVASETRAPTTFTFSTASNSLWIRPETSYGTLTIGGQSLPIVSFELPVKPQTLCGCGNHWFDDDADPYAAHREWCAKYLGKKRGETSKKRPLKVESRTPATMLVDIDHADYV